MADKTDLEKQLSFIRKTVNLAERLGLDPKDALNALGMVKTELEKKVQPPQG